MRSCRRKRAAGLTAELIAGAGSGPGFGLGVGLGVGLDLGVVLGLVLGLGASACSEPVEPPGRHLRDRTAEASSAHVAAASAPLADGAASGSAASSSAAREPVDREPADREPAEDDAGEASFDAKVASIAMRTWIYQEPREHAQKLGYLRAGAIVRRASEAAGTEGCAGGWYAVAPRGYVCVGKGASLEFDHPVALVASAGPKRGEAMPYRYVISREPPPHLYYKLPTEHEQTTSEGKARQKSVATFGERARRELGPADAIPQYLLDGRELPKPYGAEKGLVVHAHRGRAARASAFGLIATFDWTGRPFGLTTELDLIPVDRTSVAKLSALAGVVVSEPGTPAIVAQYGVSLHRPGPDGRPRAVGEAPYRSGWVLKGDAPFRGLVETTAGAWLPAASLRIAEVREDKAGFARDGRKWIDVSIEEQLLVAYEGTRPVFATLVSTGRGELGDPEKTQATVRGTFMIYGKHVSGTMDGDETTREAFDLRDVPYIQYFHKGYALHGAYWHDDFGRVRSHGCINLAPADAAWLFQWSEPRVPEGWHGALNPNHGTLVYVHR